jgi:CheY-like chemotaxis protein
MVAANGAEALEAMRGSRPDLILTDVSMPVMNGLQFLVHLRSDFAPPLPPVIVCSGFDMTADEARRLGAFRFVTKPVEVASLINITIYMLNGDATALKAAIGKTATVTARVPEGKDKVSALQVVGIKQ